MGAYIVKQDFLDARLERELIARTDRAGAGTIDDDVLEQAIVAAEGTVNGYLRDGGYSTPLAAPIDPSIAPITLDIARHILWRGGQAREEVETRYNAAIARLRDISKGTFKLDMAEAGIPTDSGIEIRAPDRVFTDDNLSGF